MYTEFKNQLISDLKDDYGICYDNGHISLKSNGGKHNDYVTENEVLVLSNVKLGNTTNKHGLTKNTVRHTISKCVYKNTDGYKEEMAYRESEMLKNVDVAFLVDHKNGYAELMLFSEKLNYSVSLLVRSKNNVMEIGSITG